MKRVDRENKRAFVYYHTGGTATCTPFDAIVYVSISVNNALLYFVEHKLIIRNSYALPSQMLRRYARVNKIDFIDPDDLIDTC